MVSTAERTDQELVSASLHGDRQAFGQLVLLYRAGVVSLVYRLSGDNQLAEEAAQEAFIRAWQRLGTYKTQFSFRNWIFSIATHVALDTLRSERQTIDIEDLPLEAPEGKPEAEAEEHERIRRVKQAVQALPPACRAVLVLREYEGLSYADISSALDIPTGTVMSRLSYARSQLRQMLAPMMETQ